MKPVAATVSPETTLEEAAGILESKGLLGVPVVDESGRLMGTLTEVDILLLIRREFRGLPRFRFITWRAGVGNLLRHLERSRADIALRIRTKLRSTKTREILFSGRLVANPDDAFGDVAKYIFDTKSTVIPVIEAGRVVGTVNYDAVARVIYQGLAEAMSG